jgi:hypothetical protein
MSLTGVPLILLAAAATAAVGAGALLLWRRGRVITRTLSVLLLEALVVFTAGLVFNRHEQFYPSWPALEGDVGTVAVTGHVTAGRLDALAADGRPVRWLPGDLGRWHLARAPELRLPAGYRDRPGDTFPVLLELSGGAPAPQAVTVVLAPTAATTAAALLTLPADLRRDVRVNPTGWDVTGAGPETRLAQALAGAGLGVANRPPDELPPPLAAPMRLPS